MLVIHLPPLIYLTGAAIDTTILESGNPSIKRERLFLYSLSVIPGVTSSLRTEHLFVRLKINDKRQRELTKVRMGGK